MSQPAPLHVVTGALGYTGRSLTEQLLSRGVRVRTLTNSPDRPNPFGDRIEIHPLAFDDPGRLEQSLRGAAVLYNTYWVRFNHRRFTFASAGRNTMRLFDAARAAGVERVVHVSILHASDADDLAYYRGKHQLEEALKSTGLSHAIVRPGVLFGRFDVLINNIAWVLRRFPVFGVFGDGSYTLRPLHVDDMAALMVDHAHRAGNTEADAVGPERFTYRELVAVIRDILDLRRLIVSVPPLAGWVIGRCIGPLVRDVVITREEIAGLMRSLLDSNEPAAGTTRLTDWARENAANLGCRYASEVGRRVQRAVSYDDVR